MSIVIKLLALFFKWSAKRLGCLIETQPWYHDFQNKFFI